MIESYRALSLWQPWASAIALGLKHVETRHWQTYYRGPLLIHAAKCQNAECKDSWIRLVSHSDQSKEFWTYHGYPTFFRLPFGVFVAQVRLVDCVPTEVYKPTPEEKLWGNYSPGRYAWILQDIVPLVTPVPAVGRQGLWDAPLTNLPIS